MASPDVDLPIIEKLENLGKERGRGSFGAVYEVRVNGFPCIAKRLYNILSGQEVAKGQRSTIHDRFMQECRLLSGLRHPNVVQFIGVHYGRSKEDVSLVMEGLHSDLDVFLDSRSDVPLFLKLGILLDTSNALVYLHNHSPPIIHRDVKAANVLLASDMRAKLGDLGVSKLFHFHPLKATVQTRCPGTLGIMPPEALQEQPVYDTKLDVFSFGTLVLHTVNHEFPMSYEVGQCKRKGEMQIAKRQHAIDKMGNSHCLHKTVLQCLQDVAKKRPMIADVRNTLEKLCRMHPPRFATSYQMYQEIGILEKNLSEMTEKASQVTELTKERCQLVAQINELKTAVENYKFKAMVYEEDFKMERRDREIAAGKYDEERSRLQESLSEARQETVSQKRQLTLLSEELEAERRRNLELVERIEEEKRNHQEKVMGTLRRTSRDLMYNTVRCLSPSSTQQSNSGQFVPPRTRQHDDLLTSLRYVPEDHSMQGYRCKSRYEWYQTPSDVCIDIMVQNIKTEDIKVKFSENKVKVCIDKGEGEPYRLSLEVAHNILPEKCSMQLLKSKVELKLRKAEGIHWQTLDKRGTPSHAANVQYQKWSTIAEED